MRGRKCVHVCVYKSRCRGSVAALKTPTIEAHGTVRTQVRCRMKRMCKPTTHVLFAHMAHFIRIVFSRGKQDQHSGEEVYTRASTAYTHCMRAFSSVTSYSVLALAFSWHASSCCAACSSPRSSRTYLLTEKRRHTVMAENIDR